MDNIYDNQKFFEAYLQKRSDPLSYNEIVEMPEVKRHLPDLENKHVLDIGCGMGNLINDMLTFNPSHITGVEQSENMIRACRDNVHSQSVSLIHNDFMAFHTDYKYDVIVSSLVFHYIEDFNKCCQKLNNLLNNDGTLLFTMEHPIQTATKHPDVRIEDETGVYLRMEHYFDESERSATWLGTSVSKYHHTISTIINSLIANGLEIMHVQDLGQSKEVFENYDENRIHTLKQYPPFILIKSKKKK
ncbi:class I SAM-dependent DNA methyltransferase [Mammaliicoccus sp. Dog046]|uniref:class I SAM-dependent DNA methyltransferase n=1 Tax=Mammaliicoccus sp. Dog046 TaxID=3034233 RepID=UPI002B256706|nr:methyltransferase domain-containing protein [Mammaliicoccus sp. Dog046]WQK85119.1 methyltransferase domain-containing protein [Mammaliicoccus sp. Dog046]